MANFVINYMLSGTTQIKMESDFYKLEGDYFVFSNKGPRINKQYVGSLLTEKDAANG